MEKIENGEVSTLIVKDISRLGRDYLRVGLYTDVLFPEKGVRFIAISNGVDSAQQQENDFTPFLNIINEWYCRDTSKKIRAVMKSKGAAGEHLCANPPYGYMKSPDNPKQWIVDEEAAEAVCEQALFYEKQLKEEINEDGKKPLKDDSENNGTLRKKSGWK